MTQTIQALSLKNETNVTDNNLSIQKPEVETEDNMSLMLSILDKLNNLYGKLNRLNYLIQRKKIKHILNLK
jgi:hypothetical protein